MSSPGGVICVLYRGFSWRGNTRHSAVSLHKQTATHINYFRGKNASSSITHYITIPTFVGVRSCPDFTCENVRTPPATMIPTTANNKESLPKPHTFLTATSRTIMKHTFA